MLVLVPFKCNFTGGFWRNFWRGKIPRECKQEFNCGFDRGVSYFLSTIPIPVVGRSGRSRLNDLPEQSCLLLTTRYSTIGYISE